MIRVTLPTVLEQNVAQLRLSCAAFKLVYASFTHDVSWTSTFSLTWQVTIGQQPPLPHNTLNLTTRYVLVQPFVPSLDVQTKAATHQKITVK
jgi:hypothetical protein